METSFSLIKNKNKYRIYKDGQPFAGSILLRFPMLRKHIVTTKLNLLIENAPLQISSDFLENHRLFPNNRVPFMLHVIWYRRCLIRKRRHI